MDRVVGLGYLISFALGEQASCPPVAVIHQICGGAKRASTGDCLVCVSQSEFAGCTTDFKELFCTSNNRMTRVWLNSTDHRHGVKAIDGSPALYYIARNTSSTKWVVWLQGGGICQSTADCQSLSKTDLGSSKGYNSKPQMNVLHPMVQGDIVVNPDFASWNRVYIPYVSGDFWNGQRMTPDKPSNPFDTDAPSWSGYFQGHSILAETIYRLKRSENLGESTDAILTGCSAGGIGTIINCGEF